MIEGIGSEKKELWRHSSFGSWTQLEEACRGVTDRH